MSKKRENKDVQIIHNKFYYEDVAINALKRTIIKFFEEGYLPAGTIFDPEWFKWSQVFVKGMGEAKELEINHFSPEEEWAKCLEAKIAEGWIPVGSFKASGNQHYQILIR